MSMHCNELPNERRVTALLAEYEAMLGGFGEITLSPYEFEQLITHFEEVDSFDRALEIAEAGSACFPSAHALLLRRIELNLLRYDGAKALKLLNFASTRGGIYPARDLMFLRAEALSLSGAFPEALAILEKYSDKALSQELRARNHYIRSIILEQMEDYQGMFEAILLALDCYPQYPAAIRRLGIAARSTRRYAETVIACQTLLDKDPYAHHAWYLLGQAMEYQREYEEALQAFEYAFLAKPAFEPAYREYIELCLEIQAYEKALAVIEDMLNAVETDADIWLSRGKSQYYTGQYASARESLGHALELDSMCDEAYYFIGKCYAREDAWSWAAYFFQKALDIDRDMEEYLAALGEAYFRIGMIEQGSECWLQAIQTTKEDPEYWSRYATLLLNAGKPIEAIAILREAEANTSGSALEFAHCACLYVMGKKQEAMEKLSLTLSELSHVPSAIGQFLPEMESDPQIRAMLAYYSMTPD